MAIEDRGPELRAVGIGFLAFAYISMALRSYVRVFLVKAFGLDDWMMLLALVSQAVFTGRHSTDMSDDRSVIRFTIYGCSWAFSPERGDTLRTLHRRVYLGD